MTTVDLGSIRADLHRYLGKLNTLISPEFSIVVEDVSAFASSVVHDGFDSALAQLPNFNTNLSTRPFLEIADVIADYHVRFLQGAERELARKSLVEAYIQAAGPRNALRPLAKTRLLESLRRHGAQSFACLLFSMHLFNFVTMAIEDEVRTKMADTTGFELYMIGVETICRKVVKAAVKGNSNGADGHWARTVATAIEGQLLLSSFTGSMPAHSSPGTQN